MLSAFGSAGAAFGRRVRISGPRVALAEPRRTLRGRSGSRSYGGEPETHAWSRFPARYYPMTLVFIAFEMEMMFMYPWAVVYVREGATALADMGVFLGLLSLGIVYAWREGAFRWQ